MTRAEQRAYLAELKPYVVASVALFSVGTGAGLLIVHQAPEIADYFAKNLAAFVKGFIGMPRGQLALAIFLNNSVKTLTAIVLGTLLGIVPVVFLLANGAALGVAFSLSVATRGLATSLSSIMPHGVIELPAVFLGTSIGLLLGARALARLRGRFEGTVGAEIALGVRYFCSVILPLLLLAALVEAFVTAALVAPR